MNPRLGILLTLLSFALMTGEFAAVHALGIEVSLLQLTLLRGLGGLVLVALLARGLAVRVWRTERLPLRVGRGLLSFVSMLAIFYSLSALPLADATAVQYTRAVFITFYAGLLLGEVVAAIAFRGRAPVS